MQSACFFIPMLTDYVAFSIGKSSFSYSMTFFRYQTDILSRLDNSNLILGWLWRFEHCVIKVQK